MREIEKELQKNPSLLSLFETAVKCNENQIEAAVEKLHELKERRKSNLQEKDMAVKEIKVVVTYTDGYQSRFTEACLRQLAKRKPVPLPAAEETAEPDQKYA